MRGVIGRGKAEARVEGQLVCRATLTFAVEARSDKPGGSPSSQAGDSP
jgi:hypothetical protein